MFLPKQYKQTSIKYFFSNYMENYTIYIIKIYHFIYKGLLPSNKHILRSIYK